LNAELGVPIKIFSSTNIAGDPFAGREGNAGSFLPSIDFVRH
jgi:hypothetical protein